MLTSLQVRNFAIIDRVEVEFDAAMTVLTGETGAGKSILVDALSLVLGERGGTGLVRDGAGRAEFTAEFDVREHAGARAWLAEQALDADDDCVLRRVVNADGRSHAFINGTKVTLQNLKALGETLVDIHGQHFHQSLGRRDVQRDLLDHFGELGDQRKALAEAYASWRSRAAELHELATANEDRASRVDLLEFQLGELDALDLADGELDALQQERRRLRMSGKIADSLAMALQLVYDAEPDNAQNLLARAEQTLEPVAEFDAQLAEALSLLREAGIQVTEAAEQLQRASEGLDADPARHQVVEERLDAIQALARKHRVEPDGIPDLRQRLADQLESLQNAEQHGERLARESAAAEQNYRQLAGALSKARADVAGRLAGKVSGAMADLGMPGGVFEIELRPRAHDDARSWGMEDVEYRISANPGQPPRPLAKIASGGELSRMSLAIQVIASGGSAIPTMIFDEVDSGVGGGVAEMVGRRLRELAARRQVLCVTHLPQVACQADHHIRINKITDGKTTRTAVAGLKREERIEELARMLGGVEITERTREHAAEMLARVGERGQKSGKRASR
ncbi:MAG: DNA repair protein RecN [Woeseiaceae bacterium]|nr:DNA repair protein RecN [Woeseiaceae bacterium]